MADSRALFICFLHHNYHSNVRESRCEEVAPETYQGTGYEAKIHMENPWFDGLPAVWLGRRQLS